MLRLLPALQGFDVAFVTVNIEYRDGVEPHRFYSVPDATRWSRIAALRLALRLVIILLKERPDVVISTGAAPGYFALRIGRWLGARTIWIDSIANAKVLSLSGQLAGKHADLWLTQWPHLARENGPRYEGTVL